MLLSDICLSIAYIGPKSRTERPRKTKIGTEVAHVTRDSTPRSRSKGQGHQAALLTAVLARQAAAQRWAWERVGREKLLLRCRLLGRASRFDAHGQRRGAGHIVSPRAQLVEDRIRAHKAARASFYTGPP